MSIFNFRRGRPVNASAKASAGSSKAAESVEAVRKRARQRLMGSAVLVLLGVIGFPLLFETQPRPVPVDIAIDIPSRNAIKPGTPIEPVLRASPPASPDASPLPGALATAAGMAAPESVAAQASLLDKEEILATKPSAALKPEARSELKPESRPESKPELKAEAKPKVEAKTESKTEAKTESKAATKPTDDGQRAKALLEGAAPTASADKRMVVQVGAFSDESLAREARAKLEKAGLKTYTQVADTKDGKRIRVRVGPYASKAEADKAASKIKSLNLPAAVLAL